VETEEKELTPNFPIPRKNCGGELWKEELGYEQEGSNVIWRIQTKVLIATIIFDSNIANAILHKN
jgi:hypothetical protein